VFFSAANTMFFEKVLNFQKHNSTSLLVFFYTFKDLHTHISVIQEIDSPEVQHIYDETSDDSGESIVPKMQMI
jgi:hypothetical protein